MQEYIQQMIETMRARDLRLQFIKSQHSPAAHPDPYGEAWLINREGRKYQKIQTQVALQATLWNRLAPETGDKTTNYNRVYVLLPECVY